MRHLAALATGILLASAPARAQDVDEDALKVHVTGDTGLVLERRIEGTNLWESLCTESCDVLVPHGGMYRVGGHAVRPSLPIALLPSRDKRVELEVHPGYRTGWVGGVILAVVGPLVMTGGGLMALVGASQSQVADVPCSFEGSCIAEPHFDAALIGGLLTLLVGAVVTGAGIAAMAVTDHSDVRQHVALSPRGVAVTF